MLAEQKELNAYIHNHFFNEINAISPKCISPIIVIRQLVKKAMNQYLVDYCSKNTKIEDIFSEDDFKEVCNYIHNEIMNEEE